MFKRHRGDQGEWKSEDIPDGRAQNHRKQLLESHSQEAELRPNQGIFPSSELEVLIAFADLDFRNAKNQ